MQRVPYKADDEVARVSICTMTRLTSDSELIGNTSAPNCQTQRSCNWRRRQGRRDLSTIHSTFRVISPVLFNDQATALHFQSN
jgi:hypothetical protein